MHGRILDIIHNRYQQIYCSSSGQEQYVGLALAPFADETEAGWGQAIAARVLEVCKETVRLDGKIVAQPKLDCDFKTEPTGKKAFTRIVVIYKGVEDELLRRVAQQMQEIYQPKAVITDRRAQIIKRWPLLSIDF